MVVTMRYVFLLALAVVAACGPSRVELEQAHARLAEYKAAEAAEAKRQRAIWDAWVIGGEARRLQENPYTSPAVRRDPMPCARAIYAAEQNNQPWPTCKPPPAPVVPLVPVLLAP